MSIMQPFAPKQGANVNVNVTTTSQPVNIGSGQKQLRIVNKGAGDVYVYHYSSSSNATANVRAATTSDYRVASGQSSIITKAQGHDTVAIIGDAAAVVSLIPGDGW